MLSLTYGRGQVEWALWRTFAHNSATRGAPPKAFGTRVKRLLEIARDMALSDREAQLGTDFAFVAPPEKRGGDVNFAPFDAFCLAVALELLDAGFKQSEVVFLMRHVRIELERRFERILEGPNLNARRRSLAAKYPNLPAEKREGKAYADGRIFLLIKKFEITEALTSPKLAGHTDPLFLEPVFCHGIEDLAGTLSEAMPDHRRVVTVVELAATAQAVCAFLEQAPHIQRGRPKS